MQISGRPQTNFESSLLVQDLVRSGRGSRTSWWCGFRARSLKGVPTAAARVVGRECLQMTDRRISSASRSTVSSIFLFLVILTFTIHYELFLLQ
ncbi:hypothetical protein PILCRDRAFT_733045 [Piloderma croceum F 1598]|uniref:Uncharacterized protein n=1 Tax=Piloderma croceum (strain F 1598) TaxID=765440 RepID=A0A0C3EYX1_PILCF|nr:hypothetical protein PILCRDRAFT_733045 [Piloderma croceum F 1598]